MNDADRIMEEPPGEPNHGRKTTHIMAEGAPRVSRTPLDVEGLQAEDFLSPIDPNDVPPWGSGVGVVEVSRGTSRGATYGASDMGMLAHRGVLQADEYVDWFALREVVEADLGFTYAQVNEAYATGRPTTEQRQLREKIDSRLLALSRAGGNMDTLAKALDISEKTIDRALKRAREIDVQPVVPHGVVKAEHPCFKCGEPGKLRKRRFSDSPTEWVGNVALCDEHYAAGFERHPGNPAYWAFRARLGTPRGA
jgi:hypothetical protein